MSLVKDMKNTKSGESRSGVFMTHKIKKGKDDFLI